MPTSSADPLRISVAGAFSKSGEDHRSISLSVRAGPRSKLQQVSDVPILLQKSLATLLNNDFVALMRFAVEAIDDGAAQSRPR